MKLVYLLVLSCIVCATWASEVDSSSLDSSSSLAAAQPKPIFRGKFKPTAPVFEKVKQFGQKVKAVFTEHIPRFFQGMGNLVKFIIGVFRGDRQVLVDTCTWALDTLDPDAEGRIYLLYIRATAYHQQTKFEECIKDCDEGLKVEFTELFAVLKAQSLFFLGGEERYEQIVKLLAGFNLPDAVKIRSIAAATLINNLNARLKDKRFYEILNVERTATKSEIKKSYYKLARQYHPDHKSDQSQEVQDEAAEQMKQIAEAYAVLSDDTERAKYDKLNPST